MYKCVDVVQTQTLSRVFHWAPWGNTQGIFEMTVEGGSSQVRTRGRMINRGSLSGPLAAIVVASVIPGIVHVAATRRALALQDGPTVLVGHSFAGTLISEAGDDPKVSALVYVAARAPDAGEDFGKSHVSLVSHPDVITGLIFETAQR